LRKRGNGALDLLRLVPGVLRVSTPRGFYEGARAPKGLLAAALFKHVVEIVNVAARICPRDLALAAAGRALVLVVEVEAELLRDLLQRLVNCALKLVADDLSEPMCG